MVNNITFNKNKIISKYKNGISIRKLSIEYNHCRKTISKLLKENNINIRDNSISLRKYYHDEDYFETIDSEEKAYWLGFIYADGFVESKRINSNQKFGITLNNIDYDHLLKFKKSINATNPIKEYKGSGYNKDGIFVKILLTSKKL